MLMCRLLSVAMNVVLYTNRSSQSDLKYLHNTQLEKEFVWKIISIVESATSAPMVYKQYVYCNSVCIRTVKVMRCVVLY